MRAAGHAGARRLRGGGRSPPGRSGGRTPPLSRLPLLVSVPHAGLRVPPEVEDLCLLSEREIIEDGDEGAGEIYDFPDRVDRFVASDIARAIVDLNRAPEDRRPDGVVKTHTCWNVPVYRRPLDEPLIRTLLDRYYHPYHARLANAARGGVVLGVDCHTMASHAPPIGPRPGEERPKICLSNAGGTCPEDWFQSLAECLEAAFAVEVSRNVPFQGGHIIRSHASELPWVQLELNRAPFADNREKRRRVIAALQEWYLRRRKTL